MTFILQAFTDIIILPNPDLGDSVKPLSTVLLTRSMSNLVGTTIRTKPNSVETKYSFLLTRHKAIELTDYLMKHSAKKLHLIWGSLKMDVVLKTNPFDLQMTTRALVGESVEETSVTLVFEKIP